MARSKRLAELAREIDAERAADVERRLGAVLPPAAVATAALLSAAYPALGRALEANPEDAAALAAEGHHAARDRAGLVARLRERIGTGPTDPHRTRSELRRFARRERARVALRELLPASMGGADVDVTSRELADLAEATIDVALEHAMASVIERLGAPKTADGRPARFAVLGMGKLGGGELNAGSDVDLVFVYDTDEGTVGDGSTSLHELWTAVARRLTADLEEVTEDGVVWRVDLRLRPEGKNGPLVNSLAASERYYESFGRLWERAALLRARPIAGDRDFGAEVLDVLAPFVWRRQVDPSIAAEMVALCQRARAQLSDDAARDLKLGAGGIREAEFFVQTLQLIWGGREPRLRVKGTLEALRRLRAAGLVTDREGREIADGYLALRRAEHAIQNASGIQTHLIPADRGELERLARLLGFDKAASLAADLERKRSRIAARFVRLVPPPARGASSTGRATPTGLKAPSLREQGFAAALAALERSRPDLFAEALSRAGIVPASGDDAGIAELARDLYELGRHPDGPLGSRTRELFPGLSDVLLEAVADAADPEQAARYLRGLFGRLGHPGVYVRLLGDDPRVVRRLVEALGASAFVGDAVVRNPELGDVLLFARDAPTPEAAREEIAAELERGGGADEEATAGERDEVIAGALRRAKAKLTLEVALADLSGEMDARATTRVLSALADATLEVAVRAALDLPPVGDAPEAMGLAVLAMGKLGGRDLGYGSDLDVVFVFDPAAAPAGSDPSAHFARAARRVIRIISVPHPDGPGYELDTRLRPSGSQGLLVSSLDAFARYHGRSAHAGDTPTPSAPRAGASVWERLALLRARPAAGDASLCAQTMKIVHAAAYESPEPPATIAAEVHRIRMRMERELGRERPGRYDLKLGRGGLVDIEFAVQLLQMIHGRLASVRTTSTLDAIDTLAAAGVLSTEHAETLREGWTFLRRLEQRIRVVHADAAQLLEEDAPGLAPLARRMGVRGRRGAQAAAELLERYRDVTERVRTTYEAIVGSF